MQRMTGALQVLSLTNLRARGISRVPPHRPAFLDQ
jgi:hypothetical protein